MLPDLLLALPHLGPLPATTRLQDVPQQVPLCVHGTISHHHHPLCSFSSSTRVVLTRTRFDSKPRATTVQMDQGLAQHRLPSVQDALQLSQDKERNVACSPPQLQGQDKKWSISFFFRPFSFLISFWCLGTFHPRNTLGVAVLLTCGVATKQDIKKRDCGRIFTRRHIAFCVYPRHPRNRTKGTCISPEIELHHLAIITIACNWPNCLVSSEHR